MEKNLPEAPLAEENQHTPTTEGPPSPTNLNSGTVKKQRRRRRTEHAVETETAKTSTEPQTEVSESNYASNELVEKLSGEERPDRPSSRPPRRARSIDRKRRSPRSKSGSRENMNSNRLEDSSGKEKIETESWHGKVASLFLHHADPLRFEKHFIMKPVVRIHIVDARTGKYLLKSDLERRVTSYYESGRTSFILPILTKPFDMREHHTLSPAWEEEIILNEEFINIVNENTLFLFEILDLPPAKFPSSASSDGWEYIAWAFLKPVGRGSREFHVETTIRLQLLEYPFIPKPVRSNEAPVYQCFKQRLRHVTLLPHESLDYRETTKRAQHPNEIEQGKLTYQELLERLKLGRDIKDDDPSSNDTKEKKVPWRRLQGQKCRLPNTVQYRIDSGRNGCSSLAFSSSGFYLAVASVGIDAFPLRIYDTVTGARISSLEVHQDFIHDVTWSPDERFIVTSSSDGAARVFDVFQEAVNMPVLEKTFQHPCPCYYSQFVCPPNENRPQWIVSGAMDKAIRIWAIASKTKDMTQSQQELPALRHAVPSFVVNDAHSSPIYCMLYDKDGSRLLSGDAQGVVRIWSCSFQEMKPTLIALAVLESENEYPSPVSAMQMHFNGRQVLVHWRDRTTKMLDLRLSRFTREYRLPKSALKQSAGRTVPRAMLSPCGTFVCVPGGNGLLYVLYTDSGSVAATYQTPTLALIATLSFHPFDHTLAFAAFGDSEPIHVYTFDKDRPPIEQQPLNTVVENKAPDEYTLSMQRLDNLLDRQSRLAMAAREFNEQTEEMRRTTTPLTTSRPVSPSHAGFSPLRHEPADKIFTSKSLLA